MILKKYCLLVLLCYSSFIFACGESKSFPYELVTSDVTAFDTNECYPLEVHIPEIYKNAKLQAAVVRFYSPGNFKVEPEAYSDNQYAAFESELQLRQTEQEGKLAINMCLSADVAATTRIFLRYKRLPREDGFITLCMPPAYVISDLYKAVLELQQ